MSRGLFIIFVGVVLSGCGRDIKIEYYDDGAIKSKSEMANGHKHGKSYLYYPNGVVYTVHNFDSGYVYGTSSFFTKDGRLSKRITYSGSVENGPYEIYYPNGNIHETGNYVDRVKRGKVFHYYESDSGLMKSELYVLNTENKEFTYYIKRYDKKGNIIGIERQLEVSLPNDTLILEQSIVIKFKLNEMDYDSAIVVIGDFDDPNYVYEKKDTIEFIGREASTNFIPSKPGSQFLRGQWITYKKEHDADSITEYTLLGRFEENITVISIPRYQAGL